MRLLELYISNFKSLGEVRLTDLGALNLVVGYNGHGKTNLLSGIFTFVRNLGSGIDKKVIDDPDGQYVLLWRDYDISRPLYFGGRVVFSEDEAAKVVGRRQRYVIDVLNRVDYDRKTISWKLEKLLVNGQPPDSDSLKEVKSLFSYASNLVEYVPIYDAGYFDEVLKRIVDLNKSPMHLKRLWYDFVNLVSSTIPEVRGLEIWDGNKLVLNVQNIPVYIDLAASGFQRVILMLFILWISGNKVMLIEEPEVNMHPSLQTRVAKLIKRWSANSNFQVFVTTHSPYFLSSSQVDSIIVMRKVNGVSEAVSVSNSEELRLVLSLLRVRLEQLVFSKLVVLTGPQVEPVVLLNWLKRQGVQVDELGISAFKVSNEYELGLWKRVLNTMNLNVIYVGLCDMLPYNERENCVPFSRNVEDYFNKTLVPEVLKKLGISLEEKELKELMKSDVSSWLENITRKRGVDYERIRESLGDLMSMTDTLEMPKEVEILTNKIKSLQETI